MGCMAGLVVGEENPDGRGGGPCFELNAVSIVAGSEISTPHFPGPIVFNPQPGIVPNILAICPWHLGPRRQDVGRIGSDLHGLLN